MTPLDVPSIGRARFDGHTTLGGRTRMMMITPAIVTFIIPVIVTFITPVIVTLITPVIVT